MGVVEARKGRRGDRSETVVGVLVGRGGGGLDEKRKKKSSDQAGARTRREEEICVMQYDTISRPGSMQ